MSITKAVLASLTGGTIAVTMQSVCKNADIELNLIGKIGTYIVGTYCGYRIAANFQDVIDAINHPVSKEDEAE